MTVRAPGTCLILQCTSGATGLPVEFRLTSDSTIGRDARCDVPLDNPNVSRQHARMTRSSNYWVIIDLDSKHGTRVNNVRLEPKRALFLNDGDVIEIGPFALRVRVESEQTALFLPDESDEVGESVTTLQGASVDPAALLTAALKLPALFAEAGTEQQVLELACKYCCDVLQPMLSHIQIVVAKPGERIAIERLAACGPECAVDSEKACAPASQPILLSRSIIDQVCKDPESVVFIHKRTSPEVFPNSLPPQTRLACAALIEYSPTGDPIVLYAVGDRSLRSGHQWVADYVSLVATLTRQHVRSLRRAQLDRYFSPRVIELLLQRGGSERVATKPQLCEATSLFFDLRGFSLASEASASDLLAIHGDLREIMSTVADEAMREDSVIVDFHGDGMFIAWGVPFPQPDHAMRAARCADRIISAIHRLNLPLLAANTSSAQAACGIGIASGPVVSGSVGSRQQYKFGILGPSVNLASRLESLTKPGALNAPVLMTGPVWSALEPDWQARTRRVARIQPPRMACEMQVYELLHNADDLDSIKVILDVWHSLLAQIEQARDAQDLNRIEEQIADLPADHCASLWARSLLRCISCCVHNACWDGVVRFSPVAASFEPSPAIHI